MRWLFYILKKKGKEMKDETLIDSPVAWFRFCYWWGTRPDILTFGQAIEQWKKIEKQQKETDKILSKNGQNRP